MVTEPIYGNFENALKEGVATWRGWTIYYWDMCYRVALFDKKPVEWDQGRWEFKHANERLSPEFLKSCGIDINYEPRSFYYSDCLHGEHPPIQIELTLPKVLLDIFNLECTE